MENETTKELKVSKADLNLESIVKYGGQGSRFEILDYGDELGFQLIACNRLWRFRQDDQHLFYDVLGRFPGGESEEDDEAVLREYFQLDVNLRALYSEWSKNETFKKIFDAERPKLEGIRVLKQDPFEVFVRASITRRKNQTCVNGNIEFFCKLYGDSIEVYLENEKQTFYNFPRLEKLKEHLGTMIDSLKPHFGFTANHLVSILPLLDNLGGEIWLKSLMDKPHRKTRKTLSEIKQVGSHTVEHTCAFGLGQIETVLTNSHIFNIISRLYISKLPRHRTTGSMDHYEKHLRNFFRRTFPNHTTWAVCFWLAYDILEEERQTLVPAKRRRMR